MSPALRAARDEWYSRLEREGFCDIEMRHGKRGWYANGSYTYELSEGRFVPMGDNRVPLLAGLQEHPRAAYFSRISDAEAKLPFGLPGCRYLLQEYQTTGSLLQAARTLQISRQSARTIVKLALRLLEGGAKAKRAAARLKELHGHTGGATDGQAADTQVPAR